MAFQLDVRFQTAIADHLPAARGQPDELARDVATPCRQAARQAAPAVALRPRREGAAPSAALEDFGPAPDFTGDDRWFNSQAADARRAARPRRADRLLDLHLHQLHPHAAAPGGVGQGLPQGRPDDRRRPLAGVHLRARRRQRRSGDQAERHPAIPSRRTTSSATWNAWSNQYWPAEYLIDAKGHVRYAHFGEGDYDKTEAAIRALLSEAGREGPGRRRQARHAPTTRPIRRRRRPTSAPRAPSASCPAAGGPAPRRLHALRRRAPREPLRARRHLDARRTSRPPPARARR